MKIGIVGSLGIVGSAVTFGMELLNHDVKVYDIKLPNSKLEDVMGCEIVFVCVPTLAKENGECDTSIVEQVVSDLITKRQERYVKEQIIAIKSTVSLGLTNKLINKYHLDFMSGHYKTGTFQLAFVPEFLKERSALIDFTERHDLCVIGTTHQRTYEKIKEAHGRLPKKFVQLTPTEAEAVKLFNNGYNATLITFANSFHELCKKHDISYSNVKNAVVEREHIVDSYLEVNDKWRGFGGACLIKDCQSLSKMCEDTNVRFFDYLLEENKKY